MADAVSGYAYVGNDPTNMIDPLGLLSRGPVVVASGSSCYYSGTCTMNDASPEVYDLSNGPVNVAAGGRAPVQLRLPLGNYRPEPTIQNLGSMAQVRNIEEQIQRYNPSYRYTEISSSGYSQSSVNSAQATLNEYQQAFQSSANGRFQELPAGRARDSHTTLALTRAQDPNSGRTIDILSINASSTLQAQAAQIARENGYQFARGFGSQHAEVIGANAAAARGLVNPVTVSSRPICPGCVSNSLQNDVLMGTNPQRPFSFLP